MIRAILEADSTITSMLPRNLAPQLQHLLCHSPAVVLLGPRQIGKTTLALDIGGLQPCIYLDLEDAGDRAKLSYPADYPASHADKLEILDELHRLPELFQSLRGIIDQGRRRGKGNGRFLLLGSASLDLMRQSEESLAGRISYLELGPLQPSEIVAKAIETLWVRGAFPLSFLTGTEDLSLQ